MPWGAMIEAWASAQKYFIFGSLPADAEGSILSYTQLISYSSHEVGCALVHCPESASPYFYLCHFCPGGNIIGKLAEPYKEGPSCEACPGNCEDKLCTNP
ncbi:cysteine-rich venom protein-like [Podarcis raffonei]|uniref:cysteine-rich venom protein-like n=1 Tax=Podarcis raffonei TaxID=65483 RepID=UPI0023293208|nr:cysteine-rich venom protein-like [Podarcis raffonei]